MMLIIQHVYNIVLASSCGNGVVDTGEGCDDGANNSDTDANACRTNCSF